MTQRRRGFTLVEIMVSMALTIFILTILAQAFGLGADTFRTLKAVGDLNDSLRTAANMLRSDLAADHFDGKRRLSDSRFWIDGPPQQGYFFFYLPQSGVTPEGVDADNLPSRRNTGPTVLAFTVKAKGNRPQDFFSIQLPTPGQVRAIGNPDARFQQPGNFNSQWSEVLYFLAPVTTATAGGTPLFALYRQQRLVVSDVDQLNWGALKVQGGPVTSYDHKLSYKRNPNPAFGNYLYFSSPADLTMPERRTACNMPGAYVKTLLQPPPAPIVDPQTNQPSGEDLLLQDVLSFDVKVLFSVNGVVSTDFVSLPLPPPALQLPYFDTWSTRHDDMFDYSTQIAPSQNTLILAIQVTLRIWNPGARLARQVTIVQEM